MSGEAERTARIREAVGRARVAVKTLRVLLAATEAMLSAIEGLLGERSSDGLSLRRTLGDFGNVRRAADEAMLGATEAADHALDALGAQTRFVT
jgi:hypothetical protein